MPLYFTHLFALAEYNIAPGKRATQSSVYEAHGGEKAIEGCASRNFARSCCTHTNYDMEPWWEMDMGTVYEISKIVIQRRYEGNCTCANNSSILYI